MRNFVHIQLKRNVEPSGTTKRRMNDSGNERSLEELLVGLEIGVGAGAGQTRSCCGARRGQKRRLKKLLWRRKKQREKNEKKKTTRRAARDAKENG